MAPGPLIVIVGPTASGKTALAIELAQKFGGEIVCADSRTVYSGMDIGTAKPTADERAEVRHHLLDVASPDEAFTAADFKELANEAIKDIVSRGQLPIMVGGSGLYIDAVLFDYGFAPQGAARDPKNPRHMSKSVPRPRKDLRDNTLIIGLSVPREVLRERIEGRVEAMIRHGLLEEVRHLLSKYPDSKALDAPGYKAFRGYLAGLVSLDEAKASFVRNDLQLAKRQRTWFKRNPYIHWFDDSDEALAFVTKSLIDSKKTGKNSIIIPNP